MNKIKTIVCLLLFVPLFAVRAQYFNYNEFNLTPAGVKVDGTRLTNVTASATNIIAGTDAATFVTNVATALNGGLTNLQAVTNIVSEIGILRNYGTGNSPTLTGSTTNTGDLSFFNNNQTWKIDNAGSGQGLNFSLNGSSGGSFSGTKITWPALGLTTLTGVRLAAFDVQGNLTNRLGDWSVLNGQANGFAVSNNATGFVLLFGTNGTVTATGFSGAFSGVGSNLTGLQATSVVGDFTNFAILPPGGGDRIALVNNGDGSATFDGTFRLGAGSSFDAPTGNGYIGGNLSAGNQFPQALFIGDSMTDYAGSPGSGGWVVRLRSKTNWANRVGIENLGKSGDTISNDVAQWTARYGDYMRMTAGTNRLAFVMKGYNDIAAGASVATVESRITNVLHLLRLNGWKTVAMTIPNTNNTSLTNLNDRIIADSAYWDYLVDVNTLTPELSDGVHPSGDFCERIANWISTNILPANVTAGGLALNGDFSVMPTPGMPTRHHIQFGAPTLIHNLEPLGWWDGPNFRMSSYITGYTNRGEGLDIALTTFHVPRVIIPENQNAPVYVWGAAGLAVTGTVLTVNGSQVLTNAGGSATDWSTNPAVSVVNMANYAVSNVSQVIFNTNTVTSAGILMHSPSRSGIATNDGFYWSHTATEFDPGTPPDEVSMWGHNLGGGGARVNSGPGATAFGLAIEGSYNTGGKRYAEFHVHLVRTNGTQERMLSSQFNKDDLNNLTRWDFRSDLFNIGRGPSNSLLPYVSFTPGTYKFFNNNSFSGGSYSKWLQISLSGANYVLSHQGGGTSDLTLSGFSTVGLPSANFSSSGHTITTPGTSGVTIQANDAGGVGIETLLTMKSTSSSTDFALIGNNTPGAGIFVPAFGGYVGSGSNQSAVKFIGLRKGTDDTATANAVIQFSALQTDNTSTPLNGNYAAITNSIMFAWTTVGKTLMRMFPDGTLAVTNSGAQTLIRSNSVSSGTFTGTNGIASLASNARATIAASGWTNTYSVNAVAWVEGVSLIYEKYNAAGVGIYTNTVAITGGEINLQPGGAIRITGGTLTTGFASPF